MKHIAACLIGIAMLGLSACASEEEIRVTNVLGPYDCAWICSAVDLTAQVPNVETDGNETVFVSKAEDWDQGYVDIGGRVVFLEPDSSFSLSRPDYFFSGEFTASGQLIFTEVTVHHDSNLRHDCDYVGYLK